MGLIDKFKNLFTEEVEVEEKEDKKDTIQKEVIQVEIPSPKKSRSEIYADEIPSKNETPVQIDNEPIEPAKNEYKFPFFDDNDFDSIDVKPEPKEEKKKQSHHRKEVYNPPKEEKRVFRPSPIISPVYGILDKGYQRDEFTNKNDGRSSYYSSKEANVDAIRNKAYGGLEADIETTLFGGNRVLFNEKEETKTDVTQKVPEEEKTSKVEETNYDFDSSTLDEKPRHGAPKEDDLTDLLEEEMDKPVTEEKHKKEPRKISDKELFSLIDSMYEKGNK